MQTIEILGVRFACIDKEGAYEKIDGLLSKRGNARVFTPNAEILYRASREPELRALLGSADMLLPDGVGVVLASRLSRAPLPCRITGIDTAEHILRLAAKRGLSVFLLGGKEGVAEKARAALEGKIRGLRICGTHHGYFERSGKENEAVVRRITDARPDILFVCLGFPAQERWIAENTPALPFLRLSMGLGGSLDVWSGQTRRAPRIVQRMGLEWLARSFSDVKRIKRLKYLFYFACAVVDKRLALSKMQPSPVEKGDHGSGG